MGLLSVQQQFPKLDLIAILITLIFLVVAIAGLEKFYINQGYKWASDQQVTSFDECKKLTRSEFRYAGYADRRRVKGCKEYLNEHF